MLTTTKIALAMESGNEYLIEAVVCGEWAAHLKVNDWSEPPVFCITHVPTGRCLRAEAGEETAIVALTKLEPVRVPKGSIRAGKRVKTIVKRAGFRMWKRSES